MKRILFVSVVMLFVLPLLAACGGGNAGIVVKDAWSRPAIADGNGGVFFTLDNQTDAGDKLVLATSDVADVVELHKTTMEDGVMKMTPQEFVDLPINSTVAFAPGGLHVMLIGLKNELSVGDTFQVTLEFENHEPIQIDVTVREP